MKDVIIYLHGFRSGPQSEKSVQLKHRFPELITASYDTLHPDVAFAQLEQLIRPYVHENLVLVGSSLGGFWACQMARKHALKCVLLNPCMTPEVSLRACVGEVENMYSGEKGVLALEDLLKY